MVLSNDKNGNSPSARDLFRYLNRLNWYVYRIGAKALQNIIHAWRNSILLNYFKMLLQQG